MPTNTPTQTVLYTLEQAIKAYRKLCQQNLDRVVDNLTVDQALTLVVLDKYPALNQQQLAERVFKDKASLTRIIELLVQKGLVSRAIHATDRRKFDLHLSAQGRLMLGQLTDTIGLNQQAALRGLAAEELAQLHATLLKVIANCTPTAPCA